MDINGLHGDWDVEIPIDVEYDAEMAALKEIGERLDKLTLDQQIFYSMYIRHVLSFEIDRQKLIANDFDVKFLDNLEQLTRECARKHICPAFENAKRHKKGA